MSYYSFDISDVTEDTACNYHVTIYKWTLIFCMIDENRPPFERCNFMCVSRKPSRTGVSAVPPDSLAPLVMTFGSGMRDKFGPVIWWRHFPRYWPFVRGIHRWSMNSPLKGQWRGALMFSLICAWINGWVNNRETGGLRRHRDHYEVTVINIYWMTYIWRVNHINVNVILTTFPSLAVPEVTTCGKTRDENIKNGDICASISTSKRHDFVILQT